MLKDNGTRGGHMKKNYIFILLLILIVFTFISIEIILPYIKKRNIKTELKEKWNIHIDLRDELILVKKNKKQWHGEQQRFILLESNNLDRLYHYINEDNFKQDKASLDLIERVVEIEDILNIENKDRVNFSSSYYHTMLIKQKMSPGSEQKNDLLHAFIIKENNKLKIFFMEDLNVLDLEKSKF